MLRLPRIIFRREAPSPVLKLIPKKRVLSRILFDVDSRLPYRKIVPILDSIYTNLPCPEKIALPSYAIADDLMTCRVMLQTYRESMSTIDRNLVAIEHELLEQAAEMGQTDAISILAFKAFESRLKDSRHKVSDLDYKHAQSLIEQLVKLKHPLTFKLLGDAAFKRGVYAKLEEYWQQFIALEPDTLEASQVYATLGQYYYRYRLPRPNLRKARDCFEKSIRYGSQGTGVMRSHYYLGQLHIVPDPCLARYHLEQCAMKGFKESFIPLALLEKNAFRNYNKAIEWFKLGFKVTTDISCYTAMFDCYYELKDFGAAVDIKGQLQDINQHLTAKGLQIKLFITADSKEQYDYTLLQINRFLKERLHEIKVVEQQIEFHLK